MIRPVFLFTVMGLALLTFTGLCHAANCEELLGNNVYRCEAIGENSIGPPFNECFRFNSTAPTVSNNFDLTVDGLGDTLGCSCKATGKVARPAWDQSKEWVCVTSATSSEGGFTWGGKVAGKGKISKVYAISSDGSTYMFSCVIDPACVYEPSPIADALTVYGAER